MQPKRTINKIKDFDAVVDGIKVIKTIDKKEKREFARKVMEGPFMDLRCDWAFKYFFEIKQNLSKFITDILGLEVTDLEYLPNEIPVRDEKDRRAVMDVQCKNGKDKFLVEMQRLEESDMDDRLLYYGSTLVHNQVKRGDKLYLVSPVYVLCITDYERKHQEPVPEGKFLFHYHNREQDLAEAFGGDRLHFYYLELPRMKKMWEQTESDAERWSYIIKNLSIFAMMGVADTHGFGNVIDSARIDNLSETEQQKYLEAMITEHYIRVTGEAAYNRGRREGEAQGMEKGAERKAVEIARQMLTEGLPVETIAKCTGLSLDEVKAL